MVTQTSSAFRGDSEALGETSREMGGFRLTYFYTLRGDRLLACLEVQLPTANQFMELAFQSVFNLGVPRRGPVRFRPEIFDRIGTAEFEGNQMIDLPEDPSFARLLNRPERKRLPCF